MTKEQFIKKQATKLRIKHRYDELTELECEDFIEKLIQEAFFLQGVGCSLPSKVEINFDGNLLAEIETTDKKLKFLRAVNGYGEAVNVAKIQVVKK